MIRTVIEKDGEFWGVQYSDGHCTEYGYGPIWNAKFVDRKYCKTPLDATYKSAPKSLQEKLSKGRIVDVEITVKVLK